MKLVLERSTIRPWRVDDAASLAKGANNRNVWLGLRDLFPHPYTIDDANEFLQRSVTDHPTTKFCIEVAGEVSGGIGIRINHDVHRHTVELGYWLSERFWRRGIMSEAAVVFADYCFENFPLHRI